MYSSANAYFCCGFCDVFLVFWGLFVLLHFFLAPRLGHACPIKSPPCLLLCTKLPFFCCAPFHDTPEPIPEPCGCTYTPFTHICGHVCVGVFSCFCVVVGRTECARVVVFVLAGVSVLFFLCLLRCMWLNRVDFRSDQNLRF